MSDLAGLDTVGTEQREPERDRYGRALLPDPETGKRHAYQRASSYAAVIESHFALAKWQQRSVAVGLAQRPDLLTSAAAHHDDTKTLDGVCESAIEASRGTAAATIGTATHRFTEIDDRGMSLPPMPDEVRRDVDAYAAATSRLTHRAVEQFVAYDGDGLRIAGTADRLSTLPADLDRGYITELKTGRSIDYGAPKFAAQMAIYAAATPCDPITGARSDWPVTVDQQWGLLVHVPAGSGRCGIVWVDLEAGRQVIELASAVRAVQKRKRSSWYTPFAAGAEDSAVPDFSARVAAADTVEQLRDVYRAAVGLGAWTDALHAACLERKKVLS